ncbi:DnaJ domain-containing protein [Deltaproteobacteria bacterium]|nr:DnaJ domain-containing protein [Deltaproteobacteria bacterium]
MRTNDMRRKPQRRFGMRQAFKHLDLDIPKLKGTTQAEVNKLLLVWKNTILKTAYRTKVKEVHPDQNAEDPDAAVKFKDVREAFEQIRDDLKINLKHPTPPPPEPNTKATKCGSCGKDRVPEKANFCYDCGTDYNMEALERRLRGLGLKDEAIKTIKRDGTYARLSLMPPLGKTLKDEINLLAMRQKLGLYGKYSGWP